MRGKRSDRFQTEADFRAAFARKYAVNPETGCWEWTGARSGSGYGVFVHHGRNRPAHRVMYEWVNGGVLPEMYIRHQCDNKLCVNPVHLVSGSPSDNAKDAWKIRSQKMKPKEAPPQLDRLERRRLYGDTRCKLTEEQVMEMKRIREEEKLSYQKIADRFGVKESTARFAIQGQRWGHLEKE